MVGVAIRQRVHSSTVYRYQRYLLRSLTGVWEHLAVEQLQLGVDTAIRKLHHDQVGELIKRSLDRSVSGYSANACELPLGR